jgi:predicted site-specific integrase-resolvase
VILYNKNLKEKHKQEFISDLVCLLKKKCGKLVSMRKMGKFIVI